MKVAGNSEDKKLTKYGELIIIKTSDFLGGRYAEVRSKRTEKDVPGIL